MAAWLGDREKHEIIVSMVKVAGQVEHAWLHSIFPGWEEEPGAGDKPKPIFRTAGVPPKVTFSQERLKQAEGALGVKLVPNLLWLFPYFDTYVQGVRQQTPDNPMHMVILGLWTHLLQAVFWDLRQFLEKSKRDTGTLYFGKERQHKIWNRLRDWLTDIDFGESDFTIDNHVAGIALTCIEAVQDKGKLTLSIKAREHYSLMMSLPFCLESLLEPELEEIRQSVTTQPSVAAKFLDGVHNPCGKYAEILETFRLWFFKARKSSHTETSILEVATLGHKVQILLKEMFPNWAGSKISWKFPKLHAMWHVPRLLLMFGCWENVSTQSGEMAHKVHIKEVMFATNRKDWEVQILSIHVRRDAIVHHRKLMEDKVSQMDAVSEALQTWLDISQAKKEKQVAVSCCHRPCAGSSTNLKKVGRVMKSCPSLESFVQEASRAADRK